MVQYSDERVSMLSKSTGNLTAFILICAEINCILVVSVCASQ